MKRIFDNLYVDFIAAALMLALVMTGYILRFSLPPGTNKSLSLWGLTRHQWGGIHFWISLTLLVLIVVHVCLHWQWIIVMVKRRFSGTTSPASSRLVSGALTVVVLMCALALFGWAAQSSVRRIGEPIDVFSPSAAGSQVSSTDPDDVTPSNDQRSIAFWSDVYPIFYKSCLACHGPRKQVSGFRVDQPESFFAENGATALVLPGDSKNSPLVAILSGGRKYMARANVHELPKNELAIVIAWIDAGAEWPDRPAK